MPHRKSPKDKPSSRTKATRKTSVRRAKKETATRSKSSSATPRKKRAPHAPKTKRWSKRVTRTSNALDLEPRAFLRKSALEIARSLKRSAEQSHRRRSAPYRSAMSMLTFYINRAGKKLSSSRRTTLEKAKEELRSLFGKKESKG
jgi:hypothetical protein